MVNTNNIPNGSTINIKGTKVDGTSYDRTVEFNSEDQRVSDVLTVVQDGEYRSFRVSGINSLTVV